MKKTIYLHIGTPKTGTTSLEVFLGENARELAQHGFFVPPYVLAGTHGHHEAVTHGHHELALSLIKDFSKFWYEGWPKITCSSETAWQRVLEQISESSCPNVILSSDIFHEIPNCTCQPHSHQMGEQIRQYLTGFKVYVLVYVRPIDEYIKSIYCQNLSSTSDNSSFIETIQLYANHRMVHLYPSIWLDFYSSLFGKEALIVKKYDRSNFRNGSIIDDFMDTLGIPLTSLKQTPSYSEKNPSLPFEYIDLKRSFNTAGISNTSTNWEISGVFQKVNQILKHDPVPANFWNELADEILREHRLLKDQYGVDLGEDIKVADMEKTEVSRADGIQLGLMGILIRQMVETDKQMLETDKKLDASLRQIVEIDRKLDASLKLQFNAVLLPYVRKATPAIVYPAGAHASWLMKNTILTYANIIAWVDRDTSRHGQSHFNAPIIAPSNIATYSPGVVFVASPDYGREILDTLSKTLLPNTEIVFLS